MKNGKIDQEIKIIKRVAKAVEGLDGSARWRVLNYVMATEENRLYKEQPELLPQTGTVVTE